MRLTKIYQALIVDTGEVENTFEFESGLKIAVSDEEYRSFFDYYQRPSDQVEKSPNEQVLEEEGVEQL